MEDQPMIEPPVQDPPLKKLYNGLREDGKYTKSFDEFKAQYSKPEAIDKLYNGLYEDKDYTRSKEDFQAQYFSEVKKKESTPLPSPSSDAPSRSQSPIGREFNLAALAPKIPSYMGGNQAASTSVAQPKITATYDDFKIHNAERKEKKAKLVNEAIENTARKVLKNKGIVKPQEGDKAMNLSEYMQMAKEKKRLQEAFDNGDATFAIGKDGEVGLKRTTGFWESLKEGWNGSMKANDEAKEFTENMDAAQKVEYLHKKETEVAENPHPEYLGTRSSGVGSVGELIGENAPFLAKAGIGAGIGAIAVAGAPETMGASLAGLPTAMGFIMTAEDSKNQGVQAEVTRRFYKLKEEFPNEDEVVLMKQAEDGALVGGLSGILTNAALMTGVKTPLSLTSKNVVVKAVTKAIGTTVYASGATAAIEGAKQAEGNLEGIKTTPEETAKDMATTFGETATTLGLLHVITGAATGALRLPKTVSSAFKYALKDVKSTELKSTLEANEKAGTIPQGTTEKVMADIEGYKAAVGKTVDGLSPEVEASVAGLIQAKDNLLAEQKTKDDSAKPYYEEKIAAINEQIQKTIDTGKPYKYEVDEMSGERYTTPEKKIEETQPIQSQPSEVKSEEVYKPIIEPSKTISEMNSDELYEHAIETRKALNKQDKEFENKTEKEKHDEGYYNVIDNVEDLRDASQRVNYVENSENITELAKSVKSVLNNFDKDNPSETTLAVLNAAKKKAVELGIETNDLIKEVVKEVGSDYKDIEDAEFMMRNAMDKIVGTKSENTQIKNEGTTGEANKPISSEGVKTKVVDEKGEPLVVYHGTSEDVSGGFKPSGMGSHEYFYFAKDKKWVDKFKNDEAIENKKDFKIGEYNLDIKNPLDLTNKALTIDGWIKHFEENGIKLSKETVEDWQRRASSNKRDTVGAWQLIRRDNGKFRNDLKNSGYDGLIISDVVRGKTDNTVYVALDNSQIKPKNAATTGKTTKSISSEEVKSDKDLKGEITESTYIPNNYENAKRYTDLKEGDVIEVPVRDLMPRLGGELGTADGKSKTDAPIDVRVLDTGVLQITDGHNRFKKALLDGEETVRIKVGKTSGYTDVYPKWIERLNQRAIDEGRTKPQTENNAATTGKTSKPISSEEVKDFDLNKVKKPSGSIGSQGATPEGAKGVLDHLGIDVKFKGEPALKEMVEHLKANPKDLQKLVDFTKNNPIEFRELPDGTYQLEDGHHRATLLYYAGVENAPSIIKNAGEYIAENKPIENGTTTSQTSKPISTDAEQQAGQGTEGAVQENIKSTSGTTAKGGTTVLDGGKEPPKVETSTDEGKSSDKFREKGILNRLFTAEKTPQQAKKGFEEKGLKYEPQTHQEAEQIGKAMVDEYGIDDAVTLAETAKFKGGVNSAIFAESLNRVFNEEQAAKTPEAKLEAAKRFAEIGIRYDEFSRGQGRDIAQISHFYKKSPLGIKIMEETRRREEFDEFSKKKDQSWKEFFDEMTKDPDFEKEFKTKVSEELKKERAELRAKRIKKVDDMFDDAIKKLKDGGQAYATFIPIPPKALALALEGMKKAYHGGEKVVKIIEDAIDYINKEVGGGWDKESFRKEWEQKLGEYETKTELPEEKRERILERFRKKLKGLSEKEKDEVIRKAFKKLVENGALEYADFKKIIADTLGYGEMTAEQAKKIVDLVGDINKVEDMATKLRENERSEKALNEYIAAKKKAEKSATDLGKIVFNKIDLRKRILGVMQLNTLGIPSLVNNPVFNVINQASVRLPRSVIMSAIDFGINKVGKAFGKDIKPENNVVAAQGEFYKKLGQGAKQSTEQLFTGLTNRDYFQKEVYASQIHPATSIKELWDFAKGKTRLSKEQVVDKAIQGTVGVPAEIVARVLNIGDKPQRYAAEGGQAATFAKNLGLQGIDYKLFMEFPKEEAYRKLKKDGLSDEVAMKKAEQIQERIIKEGEESVFQEDNLVNDFINGAFESLKGNRYVYGFGQLVKTMNLPFVKIPLNAFWSIYNLANPEIAFLQSITYGVKAFKTKSALDIQQSKKWFAHGVTGLAWMGITGALAKSGIINPVNQDETTKKEREGEQFYEQQNSINMSKLQAYISGDDPSKVKNGLNVDLKWLGNIGNLMGYQARKLENMTPEQKEKGLSLMEDMMANLSESGLDFIDRGVFSNTGAMFTAISKGGAFADSYLLNLVNMGTNVVHPAMFAQVSRAQLPYYSKVKAETFYGEVKNSMLARSSVLRDITGANPPSKVGLWGDRLDKKDNWPLRLFGMSKSNDDNFAQPIYKDYKRTNDTRFFPSAVKPTVKSGDIEYKLPPTEALQLETLVGQARKQLVAPYINDMATFEGSDLKYSQIKSDEEKIKNLDILYDAGYETGKSQFILLHPQYKAAETQDQAKEEQEAQAESNNKQLKMAAKEKMDKE